jgi:hypothetical protein
MNDMSQVIVPKSDQINADDLIGRDMTITIRDVRISGGQEQPVSIFFDGSEKAFRPCKSMSRVLVAAWGPDAKNYIGRALTLYRDPTVKWGGLEVGGIRISHMTNIDRPMTMALTATKGSRKPYTVKPLAAQQSPAEDGLSAARAAVAGAATLDALRVAWSSKAMAPYRDQLQGLLDQRKAELAFDSPAAAGAAGEAAAPAGAAGDQATVDVIVSAIRSKELLSDLTAYETEIAATYEALPPHLQEQIDAACAEQRRTLQAGKP